MTDLLNAAKGLPIPTILIVVGIVFLLLAVAGTWDALRLPPLKETWQRWLIGSIGILFILGGTALNSFPGHATSSSTPSVGVATATSTSAIPSATPTLTPAEVLTKDERITPAYSDLLNNADNPATMQEGWKAISGQSFGGACTFLSHGLNVSLSKASISVANPSFCQATRAYQDVLVEITVMLSSGCAGLLFRDQYYNNQNWGYYAFLINPSAQQFEVTKNGNPFPNAGWQSFPSGISGGNTYTLQVIAQKNAFSVYIDKQLAIQLTDTENPYMEGSMGLVDYNALDQTKGAALFSDVSARVLPD